MTISACLQLTRPEFVLNVDLNLPSSGVTALYGASGSGKTTLLRCIAGLERECRGTLQVKDETWQDEGRFLPTHQRRIGYVFQEANLVPHLDVAGNLDFAARRSQTADSRNRAGVIELLAIGHLLTRGVEKLSGGERQRVAIARALLSSPQLLMMDEPLASLDAARKSDIMPFLERLHTELDIPILYVSHAFDEVARLADHLVLLDQGKAIGAGPLDEVCTRLDLPLAQRDDAGVVIDAVVSAHDREYHLMRLDFAGGSLHAGLKDLPLGSRTRVSIQARDVSLALSCPTDSSINNRLCATIVDFTETHHPSQLLTRLDVAGTILLARITRRSRDQLGLNVGQQVWAQIKSVALVG